MPKAVVVTGCALLFGVVASATFLTTNAIGNKVFGLNEKAVKEVSSTTQNKPTLTKNSSVVTSDVSGVAYRMPRSYDHKCGISRKCRVGGTSAQEVTSAGTGIIK